MKFRDIARGTRAVRVVALPLVNVRCDLLPDLPELEEQREKDRAAWEATGKVGAAPDASVSVGLRVLTGDEFGDVLSAARAFAIAKGVADPKEGDPLYELGKMVHTILAAAVDPDAPAESAAPFFASADEILSSPHIGRDGIVYLAEQHELWQDQCSPQAGKVGPADLLSMVAQAAGDTTGDFFGRLRPGMRWTLLRTLAALWISSLTDKSPSSSTSEAAPETSPNEPAPSAAPTVASSKRPMRKSPAVKP